MWIMNCRVLGKRLSAVAAFVLVVQLATALSDPARGSRHCPPPPPNEPKAAVLQDLAIHAEKVVLHLNGSICIGYKADKYFEAEHTAADAASKRVRDTTADLKSSPQ